MALDGLYPSLKPHDIWNGLYDLFFIIMRDYSDGRYNLNNNPLLFKWLDYIASVECIFCKIVKGEAPVHKIWEDKEHLAFLSIFPNTEGVSVVITKKHYPSYAFDLPEDVLIGLTLATKKVAKLLDNKLEDVGRTGMVFEGFGVNHVHTKLFPLHGTRMSEWRPIKSNVDKYFEQYEGYISSHDYSRADDKKLADLAKRIRGE